jgi:hypothetical protein
MERKTGFYWVRIGDEWFVAKWQKEYDQWVRVGIESYFYDNEFDEIDENILKYESVIFNSKDKPGL